MASPAALRALARRPRRWGGNPMTRYNWQLGNAYNVGKDWFFENGKTGDYREYLSQNQQANLASALTVP